MGTENISMKKVLSLGTILLAIIAIIALIVFLLKGPNKNEVHISHDLVVHQIEELGNLEVVRYNIQDMMEYTKMRRWLPNSRTSLKVVGEVIACVDLTRIEKDDIYTKGDSVSIILPVPEICHHRIDHSRSRVYDIEFGLWESANLVDEAYKEAEKHIYQEAISMGIAEESRENAVKALTPILRGLGFNKIYIGFKPTSQGSDQPALNLIP